MLYTNVCMPYRNTCLCVCAHKRVRTLYVQYIYTLQVHVSTSDSSHSLYWMRLSIRKPQEIHFKMRILCSICATCLRNITMV